ncbi:bifunctional folylpolyglutamate synthase/dihydrofolate synthase [Streptococcus catagoni]|uniref:bifunctional folylpolyglutamate synthase/dihydrofolate synthase n=1 Tax=Streptococcus catagoni TaxID=2654874 RepID=UPI00140C9587|nr:folylpolyglutamate synthase/dihydrofolate synthase family protein [Streptococcus catagoni]
MNYQETLKWIHSKVKMGEKPGLKRVEWLLKQFGNPHRDLAAIHLVGTNGKGSTVSYLQHIFSQSGYEVGTFTSPFIVEFRERISVNGKMIAEKELIDLVEQVKPVVERLPKETPYSPATEFEIITVMMFLYFTRIRPVDIAIIEAGLGGLWDATNVFHALAVLCPSIGLDHQEFLGHSHKEIAKQKIGVLKAGEPFIYATDRDDVAAVFKETCQLTGSPSYQLDKDFFISHNLASFDFKYKDTEIKDIKLAMLGEHQKANAALATMASLLLREKYAKLSLDTIKEGLEKTKWVGRTEFLGSHLMIDGAHNMESIEVLVDLLKSSFSAKKVHLLFSAVKKKPVNAMLDKLEEVGDVTVTSFPFPKALPLEAYPEKFPTVSNFESWLQRLDQAKENDLFVVTGSLYFISQVRQAVLEKKEKADDK